MGGVDHHDQLRQHYNVDRRSVKWWHRIAFGLLDIAITNSFLLMKNACPDNTPSNNFLSLKPKFIKMIHIPGSNKTKVILY